MIDSKIVLVTAFGAEARIAREAIHRQVQSKDDSEDQIEWDLQISGIGPARAHDWAKRYLPLSGARAVLITGFCGSLSAAGRVGDVILPTRVVQQDNELNQETAYLQNLNFISSMGRRLLCEASRYRSVPLVTVNEVIETPEQRSQLLLKTRAEAVDMEAASIVAVCETLDLPFFVLKIVSDDPMSDLSGLNEIYQRDGELSRATMGAWLFEHPLLAMRMRRNFVDARGRFAEVLSETLLEIESLLLAGTLS